MPDQSATQNDSASSPRRHFKTRFVITLFLCAIVLTGNGCSIPGIKRTVTVPALVAPTGTAETAQLFAEINRFAAVSSIKGKVDMQFLDTSFAKCGVAEKYSTADGDVVVQRPGQVYVSIKAPFIGTKIAEMTSDGERFRAAVLQGDERYKRFVTGTNNANYARLKANVPTDEDCGGNKKQRNQERTVSALSGLRPQHFTDALLVRPVAVENSDLIYARSEFFLEEADDRPKAKRGARVVRGYYLLDELAPQQSGEARLLRRFWFDRSEGAVRFARLQTFDDAGTLVTDVIYRDPRPFGDAQQLQVTLPSRIELTRPQDRYAIRITYQTPTDVALNRPFDAQAFVLQNQWQLPEVDLDKE